MDDILARLARLESDQSALRRGVSILDAEAVRSRRESTAAQDAALVARLSPGSLGTPVGARGALFDSLPALGAPLLQRLRDDASLSAHSGGRVDPYAGYANVLVDPTFDTMGVPAATGTAYTASGPHWESKYVLNSGTVATTRTVGISSIRSEATYAYGSSAIGEITLDFGTAASDMTIYLRPSTAYVPAGVTVASWIVGSCRVFGSVPVNVTATAYLEIVDATDTVLAAGNAEDIINLVDLEEQSRLDVGYETPVVGATYRWRLRVDVTKTAGSVGSIIIGFVEPLQTFSEDGSAPAFTPAIGAWLPGLPGYQLVDRAYVQNNIPAATAALMPMSDLAVPSTVPERWAGSVVGVAYRMDGVLTAGVLAIRVQKNGSTVWTAFSLTSASAQEGYTTAPIGTYTFSAGDDIQVKLDANGAFLPTTRDIVVEVSRLLTYTGG